MWISNWQPTGPGYPSGCLALDLGGRRWIMSRLLRVGDKAINLDNIEYMIRDESNVVRIHFVHGDIALWNEQGEAFRQWVLSNAEYCEGSGKAGRSRNLRAGDLRGSGTSVCPVVRCAGPR